jgi:hypothetical protein
MILMNNEAAVTEVTVNAGEMCQESIPFRLSVPT